MSGTLRVLVVEDSVEDTFFIVRELQRGGLQVTFERVETRAAMQAALAAQSWDLIICDDFMPQFTGMAALRLFQERNLDIPIIIVSGVIGEEHAVELLKAGAHNYLRKDHLERLVPTLKRELAAADERRIRRQ